MNWLNFFGCKKNNLEMKKFLIVGIGNIGKEYDNTRHNVGFQILDYISNEYQEGFETPTINKKKGNTKSVGVTPCHSACLSGG